MRQQKQEKKKRKAWKSIILFLLIVALAAAVFVLIRYYRKAREEEQEAERQEDIYDEIRPDTDSDAGGAEDPDASDSDGDYLSAAISCNPDVVAWLTIPDTVIDFPIVQSDDNSYYLDHGVDGSYYSRGCPFLDYRCSGDFTDFNSIIYGHHIRNGQVFSGLEYFRKQEYFDAHPTGQLTLPDEILEITFIACVVVENDSFLYDVVHPGASDRQQYLETIQEEAAAGAEFVPEELTDARLIVLSTCSYDYDGARTALVGVLSEAEVDSE